MTGIPSASRFPTASLLPIMALIITLLGIVLHYLHQRRAAPSSPLNYDDACALDAEDLAEGGLGRAYRELLPRLAPHIPTPAAVEEKMDSDTPSYSVSCQGITYPIFSPGNEDDSWGAATVALFDIVNRQLEATPYRFYALNGGNDLFGILLTPDEAEAACRALPNPTDHPYLPVLSPPWFGQPR